MPVQKCMSLKKCNVEISNVKFKDKLEYLINFSKKRSVNYIFIFIEHFIVYICITCVCAIYMRMLNITYVMLNV